MGAGPCVLGKRASRTQRKSFRWRQCQRGRSIQACLPLTVTGAVRRCIAFEDAPAGVAAAKAAGEFEAIVLLCSVDEKVCTPGSRTVMRHLLAPCPLLFFVCFTRHDRGGDS